METNYYFIPLLLKHLQMMNIKCDPKQLQIVLQSAPSFPSVLSIVQAYTYFGLKATAYRADYTALEKASIPAIAHIKEDNIDRFILLHKVSGNKVSYYDAFINKKVEISKDHFCTIWSGIIVLSEKTENIFQSRTLNKYLEYSIALAIFCIVLLSFKISQGCQTFSFFCGLLGLKFAGVWFCLGLLRQESNGAYSVFDTFCHRNEAFDCAKVIQSKASKLFNKIALADLGFIYFTTGIISLCIGAFSNAISSVQQILFYLSVCSIPLILFSILYQKMVVRKWCPLCLSVISILVIEVMLFIFFPHKVFSGDLILTARLLFLSLLSSIGVFFLTKHSIENQAKHFRTMISALQLKRTPQVISAVFGTQKSMPQLTKDSLIIGNLEAPITITTLLNPMCTPCKYLAIEMIKLLESYPSFIQWHLRLDGVKVSGYEKMNEPQLYLLELFRQYDDAKDRLNIIKEWFSMQSLPKFSENYPLKAIPEETIEAFSDHVKNNNELKAEKVPSLWINNHVFPKEYSLRNIPFLLTDLGVLLKSTI